MQFANGRLYVITPYDVWCNLEPTADIAAMRTAWEVLNIGAASRAAATPGTGFGGTATTAVMHDSLILINGGDDGPPGTLGTLAANNLEDLWGLADVSAVTGPVAVSPANGEEVPVDPVTGRAEPFTLRWSALGEGQGQFTRWDIRVWDQSHGEDGASLLTGVVTASAAAPAVRSDNITGWPTMLAEHSYQWQVRGAATAAGANLTTAWSAPAEFMVATSIVGPGKYAPIFPIVPVSGGVTGINPGLVWSPVQGAPAYLLVVATDPGLNHPVGGTPVETEQTSYQVTGLEYDTTYYWGIQTVPPMPGEMRAYSFRTMSAPVTATTPPSQVVVPPPPASDVTVMVPAQPDGALPQAAVWAIVGIGGALVLAVIVLVAAVLVLIVRTRR